ncbi:hypothetical protein MMC26_002946 [Xylographa opegraphella]|nr:hypothetical protein [Xylographa opegraphella]
MLQAGIQLVVVLLSLLLSVERSAAYSTARLDGSLVQRQSAGEPLPECHLQYTTDVWTGCADVLVQFNITLEYFQYANPNITANCADFVPGQTYCIHRASGSPVNASTNGLCGYQQNWTTVVRETPIVVKATVRKGAAVAVRSIPSMGSAAPNMITCHALQSLATAVRARGIAAMAPTIAGAAVKADFARRQARPVQAQSPHQLKLPIQSPRTARAAITTS